MKQKQNIYFCGDTHGYYPHTEKLLFFFEYINKQTTKDDFMIQLGDFGYIWNAIYNKKYLAFLEWIAAQNITFCVVLGNHENYDEIETFPIIEKFGGKVRVLKLSTGEIYFFERGEIYEIAGKKVFAFGGALSIDKEYRTLGYSYWEQELPSQEEYDNAIKNLEQINYNVDLVLSHTCPQFIVKGLVDSMDDKINDPVAVFFDYLVHEKNIQFKGWHFGHFHIDKEIYTKDNLLFQCYYNKIGKVILEDKEKQ